ncbi:MAG: ABC transporter ATP-binding protein/permease, partial [Lentisphaeria bacterium]|nr:ABC transporter ATP-binding protein/permease [Lentisphaeria bacterium]
MLIVILLVGALLELAAVASIPLFVSLLLQQGEIPSGDANRLVCDFINALFGSQTAGQRLFAAGAIILIVNLIRTIWNIMGMALQYRMQANRRIELSGRLLRGYLFADQNFHDGRNSSEQLNNIILECDNVIQGTISPILEFVRGGALIVSVTTLLFIWTPAITAAALGLLGISCAAVLVIRNRRLKRLAKAEQFGREASMKAAQEALDSRIESLIYGRTSFFDGKFSHAMEGLSMAQGGNMLQIRATWPLLEFLSLTALMLVAAMAWILADGDLAKVAPQLSLLAMALVRLRSTSVNLMQSALEFRRFRPSLAKVCQDLRELEEISSDAIALSDAVEPLDFKSGISLQNLTFTYPGAAAKALDDVSLELAAGSKTAIIGATGCGKSTLLKSILGIVKPQDGKILIDGKALDE